MTKLTLVSHPLCPYVQRAAIALVEKQVPFTRRSVDLGNKPDWFKRISPQGKVPLLLIAHDWQSWSSQRAGDRTAPLPP